MAVVIAAILGFALGWYLRLVTEPSVERRAEDAARQIRERVHELSH